MAAANDKPNTRPQKSKIRPIRYIKVHQTIYAYIRKDPDHSYYNQLTETPIPWINIRGKWLRQAGFEIGTPVKIEVTEGRLVLTTE